MRQQLFLIVMLCVVYNGYAQQQRATNQTSSRAQDHNSSRSNKTASIALDGSDWNSSGSNKLRMQTQSADGGWNTTGSNRERSYLQSGWTFGINSGVSFTGKSNENSLFRGNGMATQMFGRYYFGNIGIGVSGGIVAGAINNAALNKFLTERKFQQGEISKSNPFNSYFLFGPSFKFGERVIINAELQGGMFINNPGSITISQPGAVRSLYRFEGAGKNSFPGFSGSISLAYPINNSTRFILNTGYLQTKSSINLYDPQRGIDVAIEQDRLVKLFTVGVGITKSFGSKRSAASGMATGKRHAINTKGTGATNGRIIPSAQNHAINTKGIGGSRMMNNESCGPVTQKITNPDGTTEEKTFACPADAAAYNERISMNVTVPKQTQGATFGEKVSAGLHAAGGAVSQGASRAVISGTVSWSSGNSSGIITNQDAVSAVGNLAGSTGGGAAAASYAATGRMAPSSTAPQGIAATFYTREAGSGMATGKRSARDHSSGMATGKRQYAPVFNEGDINECTGCAATVKMIGHELTHTVQQAQGIKNPLYNGNENQGTNPMYEGRSGLSKGGDNDCGGIEGLAVFLIDINSGAVVATTKTTTCGDFFFARVPAASYIVKVTGGFSKTKNYDVTIKSEANLDMAGDVTTSDDYWTIELNTGNSSIQKEKGLSNNKNELIAGAGVIADNGCAQSYTKNLPVFIGDIDDDGISEVLIGNSEAFSAEGGIASAALARPGNPIGGIIVKGGKNPGGQMRAVQTNEQGVFEFTNMEKGNYSITTEANYYVDDETIIVITDEDCDRDGTAERKGWDGTVKGGSKINAEEGTGQASNKSSVQDHNSSRSNKSSSIADNNTGDDSTGKSIVNTTKSNTKDFLVSLDELDQLLATDKTSSANAVNKAKENSRQLRNTITQNESNADNAAAVVDTSFSVLLGSISRLGQQYSSISNTLKTKHDTAKNSVGNIR
ncbi:hypothetical protein [Agriterribacter sp.]|uniref:hypothetical protein n=1 Tax=Agriterribacter sp. TaxID=2821509 RepID=UPI002BE47870|nr:hypothetical protein [Agriterribacter sp.]HRO45017.1 hypothetical protein [Agriterribacter sp.]